MDEPPKISCFTFDIRRTSPIPGTNGDLLDLFGRD
jgi:hypothetical protein